MLIPAFLYLYFEVTSNWDRYSKKTKSFVFAFAAISLVIMLAQHANINRMIGMPLLSISLMVLLQLEAKKRAKASHLF